MTSRPGETLCVEPLSSHHVRTAFTSGVEQLDRYFRTQAGQEDARKNIAAPFLLVLPDVTVAGYYTLSATALSFPELPLDIAQKVPRYPMIPATLLGRLRGEIASFALAVDAKDDNARRFYERESFLPFPDEPMKLFRTMSTIASLFA